MSGVDHGCAAQPHRVSRPRNGVPPSPRAALARPFDAPPRRIGAAASRVRTGYSMMWVARSAWAPSAAASGTSARGCTTRLVACLPASPAACRCALAACEAAQPPAAAACACRCACRPLAAARNDNPRWPEDCSVRRRCASRRRALAAASPCGAASSLPSTARWWLSARRRAAAQRRAKLAAALVRAAPPPAGPD